MGNVQVIVDELNRLYEYEMERYIPECDQLKKMGYRIYRNDDGKHKVVPPARQRVNEMFKDNELASFMNGLFGADIF